MARSTKIPNFLWKLSNNLIMLILVIGLLHKGSTHQRKVWDGAWWWYKHQESGNKFTKNPTILDNI